MGYVAESREATWRQIHCRKVLEEAKLNLLGRRKALLMLKARLLIL